MNKPSKLLIEIEPENQKFVESECSQRGFSFKSFFETLLELYKKDLSQNASKKDSGGREKDTQEKQPQEKQPQENLEQKEFNEIPKKTRKRGRPKKS